LVAKQIKTMNNLTNRTVLVAGGTGGVGEGMVKAFLRAGATVLVPYGKATPSIAW
jgi:NAD(P)-dependent dehydrogenase (short-subunit alcohol dehydrogenase family)